MFKVTDLNKLKDYGFVNMLEECKPKHPTKEYIYELGKSYYKKLYYNENISVELIVNGWGIDDNRLYFYITTDKAEYLDIDFGFSEEVYNMIKDGLVINEHNRDVKQ